MNGQWIGFYEGTNNGMALANIDDMGSHYEGRIFLTEGRRTEGMQLSPVLFVRIATLSKVAPFNIEADSRHIGIVDPVTGDIVAGQELERFSEGVRIPTRISIDAFVTDIGLTLEWSTDVGTEGICTLNQSRADVPSELTPLVTVTNWNDFKEFVTGLNAEEYRKYIFRGQSVTNRLRTSFHRTGRCDIRRFLQFDLPALRQVLGSRIRTRYDHAKPEENGAFLNLVQHHGYPTPLLDWTYSPYVAAFFAYRNAERNRDESGGSGKVRIFILDMAWKDDFLPLSLLDHHTPHISIVEFMAFENERSIPQQAVSTVTNVDDIERYINWAERKQNKCYLRAIDLPLSERRTVMRDLSMMGITAGSMLPGFDGLCEELKERFF